MSEGDYYLITGTDFKNNKIDFKTCKYISKERYDQDVNIQIKNNDILITKDGSIGKVAIVENIDKPATLNAGVYVVRLSSNEIRLKYLFHYLKAPFLLDFADKSSTGGTIKHLNQNVLGEFKIPFSSFHEQNKIAIFLDLIDERISTQSKIIKEYKAYKKKILHTIYNRFNECEYLTLDQLCTITTGKLDANAMNPDGKYKFFTCAREDYYIDTYSFDGESLIISGNGEVGLIKYYNGKFDAYQRTYVLQSFKENPMFIKFALEIELPKKLHREKNVGAMPYIVLSTLTDIKIKIPDSATISKIATFVTLLDKKIATEEQILNDYLSQKKYLLSNMFI